MNEQAKLPNPYRYEIVAVYSLAPVVVGIEVWRRWGDFLNPGFLDDPMFFAMALIAVRNLQKRTHAGQLLWLYVCGAGSLLMLLSTIGSAASVREGDPSGVPMPIVLTIKAFGVLLILIASLRAYRILARGDRFSS